jgi:hypothetical protein
VAAETTSVQVLLAAVPGDAFGAYGRILASSR